VLESKSHVMKLLMQDKSLELLLQFFLALEEELSAAAADAHSIIPQAANPSAKNARGSLRRHLMHEATERAAKRTGIEVGTGWTTPRTWSYPLIRIGAFTFTLGVAYSRYSGGNRTLRTKSKYVHRLCERNSALDPQYTLLPDDKKIPEFIPPGAYGGLFVVENSDARPDIPSFLGVWVPSKDLSKAYHVQSLKHIIAELREIIASSKRPVRKAIERKALRVRRDKHNNN
jgi:hypothetical protein